MTPRKLCLMVCVIMATMLGTTLPGLTVEPDEILADLALEARARALSRQIRCPVCAGETIDDSATAISKDLRVILRERLVAGDTDGQALDFIVARYGEGVLFKPRADGVNLVLWLAGPAMLLAGAGIAVLAMRRRRGSDHPLDTEERARLDDLMKG